MDFRTVTLACNNRCVFCAQRGLSSASGSSPADGDAQVVFAGGEPTVLDDLPERIAAAREGGADRVLLQTNGRRLAYAAYLAELVDAGLTHLDVSLHGPRAEIHDYHTQTEGSFKQTARGLLLAGRTSLELVVTTVVTRSNFRHLGATARVLRKLGVTSWLISAARTLGAAGDEVGSVPPRLGMLPDHLAAALRESSGIEVTFAGIPPCVVPSGRVARYLSGDGRGLSRTATCVDCALAMDCPGPAAGYDPIAAATDLSPFSSGFPLRSPSAWFAGLGEAGEG